MTLEVYTNNMISLDGQYVGRIDRATYDLKGRKPHIQTTFYTPKDGDHRSLSVPHTIQAMLYVGGPADWSINPDFEAEIRSIVQETIGA